MNDLTPLLISTHDIKGGAARATYRLHTGLRELDVNSHMLVQQKHSSDPNVIGPVNPIKRKLRELQYVFNHLPLAPTYLRGGPRSKFTPARLPDQIQATSDECSPDIIHLNWVAGYLSPTTLHAYDVPIVWTLHDMWPLTGGCHYSGECRKFTSTSGCQACPVLQSNQQTDLSASQFDKKRQAWKDLPITLVAPSKWMAEQAESSRIFNNADVTVIPNGLDTEFFSPAPKQSARRYFDLPENKQIILFGGEASSSYGRKGYSELISALRKLPERIDSKEMLVAFFGSDSMFSEQFASKSLETRQLGFVSDADLAKMYSAADVIVVPSRWESFGQVASEAMSCGTAVAAFATSGLKDVVAHEQTGYLASPRTPHKLAQAISWILKDEGRLNRIERNARRRAVNLFAIEEVASEYIELYQDINH